MESYFGLSSIELVEFFAEIIIFLILVGIGMFLVKRIPKTSHRLFNLHEYLPGDEIHTLKQVYYLILMAICFIFVLYGFIYVGDDYIYLAYLDILVSLYIAITCEKDTWFKKLAIFLLVPYGSLTYLIYDYSLFGLLDFIHIPAMIYFIKYYYDKFKMYTEDNGLGITIILLFSIVFISFIITNIVESQNPLNALVMVSNAFTSNGYAVLGDSVPGKINSLILVWSGFIISGVGTATLTAAILSRHFNKKFEELEELIKNNNED